MKCKVTVQRLLDGVDVEIPERFTGITEINNGLLYLVELPPTDDEAKIIEICKPVKPWWKIW